jgi:hypothetical protein
LYYGGGWSTNIGNAFIDLGALALLEAAVRGARVYFASEMPRWFFTVDDQGGAIDVASVCKCDLAVFSGMAMCEEFLRVNGPTILALRRRGIPVMLLGTGGQEYDEAERRLFSGFLKQVDPVLFVSRDRASYEAFSPVVERSIDGIDCGFFVSVAYRPPPVDLPPFVVLNFDSTEVPELDLGERHVLHTHHSSWGPVPDRHKRHGNTLISDLPQDYLTLYASAECVYSDRVHACVAALSYGRSAQLFHPTPRGGLFDAVGAGDIRARPVALPQADLNEKRDRQVRAVSAAIRECLHLD